jgi:hypothetical protein
MMEPPFELGKHKRATSGPVGSIDLGEDPERVFGVEQALGKFEAGALQFLGQPGLLPGLEPLSASDDP